MSPGDLTMDMPLYQAKSELFRALGHPVRIRVLELLNDGPQTVRQLLDALPVEASGLSQHLAVLRGTVLVAPASLLHQTELGLAGLVEYYQLTVQHRGPTTQRLP